MKLHDELLLEKSQKEKRKVGLTLAAEELNMNPASLYQVLMGKANCSRSPGVLKKIAEYFNLTEEKLQEKIDIKVQEAA